MIFLNGTKQSANAIITSARSAKKTSTIPITSMKKALINSFAATISGLKDHIQSYDTKSQTEDVSVYPVTTNVITNMLLKYECTNCHRRMFLPSRQSCPHCTSETKRIPIGSGQTYNWKYSHKGPIKI